MAHILIMPRQGNTVESCIVTGWKVKEGDKVTAETVVCEVETDKASFEVPAGEAGTVLKLLCDAGDDVPVLSPIAVIGKEGENWDLNILKRDSHGGTEARRELKNIDEVTNESNKNIIENRCAAVPLCDASSGVSPRARNLADKEALSLDSISGSGPEGRIIESDVIAALEKRPPLTAAAKAAVGAAVSGEVPPQGSGIGGRVTLDDLKKSPGLRTPIPAPRSPLPVSGEGAVTQTPIKGIRKIISDRMHLSLSETAQFTLNASACVSRLQDLRSRMKAGEEGSAFSKITVNDLILFAVSRVLARFPFMNAHKEGDTIKTFERVHLGVAVDTPRGLMVPVMRNANLLSLQQISKEAKRLASSCQNGSINPDELTGSTFTVTNLGSLGITSFTPVLNTPEVAILGVCNIELKAVPSPLPTPHSPLPAFEPHINFSLTINHQAVDGAPAARFLKALCDEIANIDILLIKG